MTSLARATAYLYHHVVLPPKLPQADDHDVAHEQHLLEFVTYALSDLKNILRDEHHETVTSAIATIEYLRTSRDSHGNVSEAQLLKIFTGFIASETEAVVPLEIKAQNAGILMSRCTNNITFEFFELSPTNEAAMRLGRLTRTFPGYAARIPVSKMSLELQKSLAGTIAKMTTQTAPGFQPQVRKNGRMMDEERDTTHPGLVTDFLMNMISALGETTDVKRIMKNTREETLWSDCLQPWRRSPLWLLVRVSLQLQFARKGTDTRPHDELYKAFMLLMLSRMLKSAADHWQELGSESLHVISAKLNRRLRKFELLNQAGCLQPNWTMSIRTNIISAHALIDKHWQGLVDSTQTNFDTTAMRSLRPENDLDITLPGLDSFLSKVSARKREVRSCNFTPTSFDTDLSPSELPDCVTGFDGYKYFRLAALEKWVEQNLHSWISSHLGRAEACGGLRRLIEKYHSSASAAYAGIPINTSVMYLTLVELWVACDTLACNIFPLLLDYRPEICVVELESLVLPSKSQMERLFQVERYIQTRQDAAAKKMLPSVYREFGHASSFAVKYFDQSESLQTTLSQIERDATTERQQKCQELKTLKSKYQNLMDRYNNSVCETHQVITNRYHGYTETRHKPGCSRCATQAQANSLTIQIFEWPVSSQVYTAKATVFELRPPKGFTDWRDASRYLITNVLGHEDSSAPKPSSTYTLDKHRGLSHLLDPQYQGRRIVPLSSIKPHSGTHRKRQKAIPHLRDDDVCLENALRYGYYDKSQGSMGASSPSCTKGTAEKCMYRLPLRSRALERFMHKLPSAANGLPPNEVIATLSDCPSHFSIDEYKALASIPLGRYIIYSNTLAQLACPAVDFTKVEVQCFMLQTIHQVGLPDKHVERASHGILTDTSFARAMLEQLEIALQRVSENWESWRASATFCLLARRILSLTICPDIAARCIDYLDKLRRVCMRWLHRLKQRAACSTNDDQRSELYSRATEIALLGTSTYDVDDSFLDAENCDTTQSDHLDLHTATLQSWRSLMYRVFPKLRDSILLDKTEMCEAVTANWAAFQPAPGKGWVPLEGSRQHWLLMQSGTLPVHFNLLTAELLVNGLPLARLPAEFMHHPMYTPLFQKSSLEVVPTDEPGMKFSANSMYHGYKVHFGMKGSDMLVVAIGQGTKLNLLPSKIFQNQLPHAFITNFIHWYNHTSNEVVFRPREAPWSSSTEHWSLKHDRISQTWRLYKGKNTLVNMSSNSARILSRYFQPLEDSKHVHVVLNAASQMVDIELPRLQLGFFVEHRGQKIHSQQYRGMIVDHHQGIGALIGLTSKLTLKNEHSARERVVLIPVPRKFGKQSVLYAKASKVHHVTVSIKKDDSTRVFAYSIDKDLGRILSNGDIQSQLYLCYLFTLTAHCLPDPLSLRTGTESALMILQSAAVRSFDLLNQDNVELLAEIAGLSPIRSFYPTNERVMQQITWDDNLPALSQHPGLRAQVLSIYDQAEKMQLFHPDDRVFKLIADMRRKLPSNSHLIQRNAIRSSTFCVSGFGAEQFTTDHDVKYNARDQQRDSERGRRTFMAATLTIRDRAALHSPVLNLKSGLLQTHFSHATIKGKDSSFNPSSLRFDSKWLDESKTHLVKHWCSLHQSLANSSGVCNKFDIMTWLSTMAYAESADFNAIQAFVAFYRLRDLAAVQPPSPTEFSLSRGDTWSTTEIRSVIQRTTKRYDDSAEARLPKQGSETNKQHLQRIHSLFQNRQNKATGEFLSNVQQQWPIRKPSRPLSTEIDTYLDTSAAMKEILVIFRVWWDNREFLKYLEKVSTAMSHQTVLGVYTPHYIIKLPTTKPILNDDVRYFSHTNIFSAPLSSSSQESSSGSTQGSLITLKAPCEPKISVTEHSLPMKNICIEDRLQDLCQHLQGYARSACEKEYVGQLRSSCIALQEHASSNQVQSELAAETENMLQEYLHDCEKYLGNINRSLKQSIDNSVCFSDQIGLLTQQSPRVCPSFWLSQLHRDRFNKLPGPWKEVMIEYGLAITQLHRAQRLAALSNRPVDLIEELTHVGHSNWDPHDHPETLLLEAESGIMVRKEQEFIANHMRSPEHGDNIVLQLLMGGGKSTVVTPMVAVALTDKEKLVRVVVAKPQSRQMLQMLVSKLGGLLNRRIYHMPFSRALRLTANDTRTIQELYRECMINRGVLLIQPEHILSFKLMGIEMLLTGQDNTARSLLSTQQFFDTVSRDIVDESDENYSVKFELIYTMGSQQAIEFAPERWLIIQEILGLVPKFALQVKKDLPHTVDIQNNGNGRYPRIRLLRNDAAEQLLTLLAKHVVEWGISGLPSRSQSPKMQAAILRYISQTDLETEDINAVENSKFWTESTKSPLLLVRGLIAGGVLRFALSTKRWRVNFGLDSTRIPNTALAVPYRFKDSPSPRSEFSHPDVVILLTLLSYYYGGLGDEELFDSFIHLLKSDQSAIHYDEWVRTAASSLPAAFRQLSGVSIRDRHQCITEIFPALRHSKKAIDYYLSCLIFPKELKQFPQKLSASGWDVGAVKTHPTTGFSGTNDTLHLLPLDVKHLDLPSQSHTNAQVLSYLLQDETSVELLPSRTNINKCSDAEHLLNVIESLQSNTKVILDCGASILEQNNKQVAEKWLEMRDDDVQAVVYFDDDELSVLDRSGRVESFQTSSFGKHLDVCLIYLDEEHTRGTDLRLPRDYRAAVTLGSQLTKDRLTQACMRMRKLGNGQAVTFIVPEEISTKICEFTRKSARDPIETRDVLCWTIGETWQDLKRSMPLWAVQGERFEKHRHLLDGANTTKAQAEKFLEDEAQDLETRYKPRTQDDDSAQLSAWDLSNKNITQIVSRCRDFEAMGFSSAALSEEQERELAPEIEQERQIERPPRMIAEKHGLHPDLQRLVCSGMLVVNSKAFEPAFQALRSTSAAKLFDLTQFPSFPSELLVTADFMRTVKIPAGTPRKSFVSDSYQRSVQFILSVPSTLRVGTIQNLIIISPHEANEIVPRITNKVTLHLFSPRFNASFAPLDNLELFNVGHAFTAGSISRSLTMQLNLFAGSLYLRSFAEYNELCDFLGLLRTKAKDGQQVYADGFIDPPAGTWGLRKSPVPFLRALLMKIRREGEGVEKTHLGKILSGVRLDEDDFNAET
ncbi:hypothetical protein BKA66DRAFT_569000 [Pyrenochaeta sp. MPI-SDFR-AT-0127]|nr:hypothetical protein BKA66DRAFT_569000 [Pyrenochaeta sp. MPI-SDFR-AT-0127]